VVSDLLLGIDIGTASSKGVLARPTGEIVATAERAHEFAVPRPGWAEHDAEAVWWDDLVAICRELAPPDEAAIAAVCVSGIGPCLLPVDETGRPLRPAILYGIDTRATAEIDELNRRYGADSILARGGSPLTTQAVGPKLLWLRHNEPDVFERTRGFLMASSFAVERLTGEYVLDHHSASQCDPLYDIHESRWIEELADEIAPGVRLPRLLWPAAVAGRGTPPDRTKDPDLVTEFETQTGKPIDETLPMKDFEHVHYHMAKANIPMLENLGGELAEVAGTRVDIGAFPWRWVNGEGCICRVVAFVGA